MIIKIRANLVTFLKEERVFEKYMDNLVKEHPKNNHLTNNHIGDGFIWYRSPEGLFFWENLANKAPGLNDSDEFITINWL